MFGALDFALFCVFFFLLLPISQYFKLFSLCISFGFMPLVFLVLMILHNRK